VSSLSFSHPLLALDHHDDDDDVHDSPSPLASLHSALIIAANGIRYTHTHSLTRVNKKRERAMSGAANSSGSQRRSVGHTKIVRTKTKMEENLFFPRSAKVFVENKNKIVSLAFSLARRRLFVMKKCFASFLPPPPPEANAHSLAVPWRCFIYCFSLQNTFLCEHTPKPLRLAGGESKMKEQRKYIYYTREKFSFFCLWFTVFRFYFIFLLASDFHLRSCVRGKRQQQQQ
jgi:hypothetical protein